MGKLAFVGWLFVMSIACVVTAASSASLGWLLGGVVLFVLAVYAARQLKNEAGQGRRSTASNRFIGFAFLALFAGFAVIIFLSKA